MEGATVVMGNVNVNAELETRELWNGSVTYSSKIAPKSWHGSGEIYSITKCRLCVFQWNNRHIGTDSNLFTF